MRRYRLQIQWDYRKQIFTHESEQMWMLLELESCLDYCFIPKIEAVFTFRNVCKLLCNVSEFFFFSSGFTHCSPVADWLRGI
jgi:hypothetical protein